MHPKVSVVMAAYNAESYICEAVDSVLAQTLADIEVILVNDVSDDATSTLMRNYAKRDARVVVLSKLRETVGGGEARNLGLSVARGEYVSVLDADDIFEPEMLAHAYARSKASGAELVMFDGDIYNDSRQCRESCDFILRHANLPRESVFLPLSYTDKLFQMTIGAAWNLLIDRELINREGLYFESLHNSNDTTFTLLALALAKKIAVLDEKLILYRRYHHHGSGIHTTKNDWPLDVCEALWRVRQGLERRGIYHLYRYGFVRRAMELTLLYLRRKDSDRSSFKRMYAGLQQYYAEKLDFWSVSEEGIGDSFTAAQCCLLASASPEAFAAGILHVVQLSEAARAVPDGAKVAIYGAGDKGADFFHQTYRSKRWEIVCWADRDYKRLGWPIVSPEEIKKYEPDYVLIAIDNCEICASVQRNLVNMGLLQQNILPAIL